MFYLHIANSNTLIKIQRTFFRVKIIVITIVTVTIRFLFLRYRMIIVAVPLTCLFFLYFPKISFFTILRTKK